MHLLAWSRHAWMALWLPVVAVDERVVTASTEVHQVAGMLPFAIARYVARTAGRAVAEEALRAAGETRTLEQLADRGAWCPIEVVTAIADAAARAVHEPNIGRRGGEELFRHHRELGVADALAAEGSVPAALDSVVTFSSRVTTGRLMSVVAMSANEVLVEGTYRPGVPAPALFCNFALGYWSQVPTVFGADGYAAELECQARGDDRCLARVSWTSPGATSHDLQAAAARRDDVFVRYEALQETAAELASAADLDAVLALVAERAATVVLAPTILVVARADGSQPWRVHSRGFSDGDAVQAAASALATGEMLPSALVVDLATAHTSYGKIAAAFPDGAAGTPVDARLMAAYAHHVAAAIERVTAFEQARRDRDTAQALLDFAAALSGVATPEETSRRLADAMRAVTRCDVAVVWLWDEAARQIRMVANSPATAARPLPPTLGADQVAGLEGLVANPRPVVLRVGDTTGILRDALGARGNGSIAVAPMVGRGVFLGIVAAWFREELGDAEQSPLVARLAGVADLAATALDNARLVADISHQALHDALTGLPNRPLVEDQTNRALAAAARDRTKVGLLFVDLDRFKNVNDTLGHRAGDELIRQVARRLEGVIRPSDTLARLGGDEFVLLVAGAASEAETAPVAGRLIDALRAPFSVYGHSLFISASVGVAVAPEHGSDYETLLQHADAAMYEAKARGRNTFAVHAAGRDSGRESLLALETALHTALPNGELAVVYQPQIDLRTMHIAGVEALVRWHHPALGLVGPDTFIPVAEESGLIVEIDRWVRRTAFAQIDAWRRAGLPRLRLGLNLSSREIRNPSVARDLAADLAAWRLDPADVEIEITDRVVMADDDLPAVLTSLRSTGVRLAIDDFGTGSSVLARLQRCPVDTLKIDKSFVQEMAEGSAPGAIVPALALMAQTLDLEIVAEGVETAAQAATLRTLGCHLAQGYFFSRPIPAPEMEALIASDRRPAPARP